MIHIFFWQICLNFFSNCFLSTLWLPNKRSYNQPGYLYRYIAILWGIFAEYMIIWTVRLFICIWQFCWIFDHIICRPFNMTTLLNIWSYNHLANLDSSDAFYGTLDVLIWKWLTPTESQLATQTESKHFMQQLNQLSLGGKTG